MSKGRFLIVEDEFVVAENLRIDLEAIGYEVVGLAATGRQAMEMACREKPDLAMMDIKLRGDMDGIETAIRLRRELHIPVLFLTAFADASTLERAKIAEPLGYLVKPFERKTLGASVEMAHYKATMERLLKESEQRYRTLFEGADDAMAVADLETGVIANCNQSLCLLLERSAEEIVGQPQSFLHPHQDLIDGQSSCFQEHLRDPSGAVLEDRLVSKSGRIIPVEIRATHLQIDGRSHVLGVFRDITDRKRTEEERQQIAKAESLNRMAGAIAHNFNNMLGVVMGSLDLALFDIPEGSEQRRLITEAMKASERAATISRLMLVYLGQSVGNVESIDVSQAIGQAYPLFNAVIPANVHLTADLAPFGPIIKGNAAQLTQVLSNLITNAVEAIGDGEGEITLNMTVISAAEIDESKFFPLGWKPTAAEYARLTIVDTGCGIDPENLDKIFDPFFSTKFLGRGLGLSVVPGLLRGFAGAISVEGQPGSGAMFKLFFPVLEQGLSVSRGDEILVESVTGEERGLLVLVVDDEPLVRMMAETMLKRKMGCEVVSACNGYQALEIFRERKEEIGLVLLDLSMPGMDGWATLSALRTLRSDAPVILTSGYDESQVMGGDHPERPQGFLQKPYQSKEFQMAIKAALRGPMMRTE